MELLQEGRLLGVSSPQRPCAECWSACGMPAQASMLALAVPVPLLGVSDILCGYEDHLVCGSSDSDGPNPWNQLQ